MTSSPNFLQKAATRKRRPRMGHRAIRNPRSPSRALCGPNRGWVATTSTSSGNTSSIIFAGSTFTLPTSSTSVPGCRSGASLVAKIRSWLTGTDSTTIGQAAALSKETIDGPNSDALAASGLLSWAHIEKWGRRCSASICPNAPKPIIPMGVLVGAARPEVSVEFNRWQGSVEHNDAHAAISAARKTVRKKSVPSSCSWDNSR